MKKLIFLIFLLLVYTNSYAGTDTPVVYRVTVNRVELYNSTTSEWVVVGEGNAIFDIASVSGGQKAGSYVSNSSIPEGVYTEIRCTVSRTMYIKGTNDTYWTRTGSEGPYDGAYWAKITTNSNLYDAGTMVVSTANIAEDADLELADDDDYFIYTQDLPTSVTVEKGLAITLRIEFNVTNALNFDLPNGDVGCWVHPPTISIENIN